MTKLKLSTLKSLKNYILNIMDAIIILAGIPTTVVTWTAFLTL